jgi:WD40 repeat protein
MATGWKRVYVFISSTFNDMHAERDYLVKRVFPQLREWSERRKLRLVDVDLRWGVTEADATHNRNVIRTCLKRIDDCRPFFVCFLGQRRGWVPTEKHVSDETLASFPELAFHIGKASVTELEILHALIRPLHGHTPRDPAKSAEYYEHAKHAYFYLRDPSYLDQLPADPPLLRRTYTNEWLTNQAERAENDAELKRWREETIPATGRAMDRPVRSYQATWDALAATPELALPLRCPFIPENRDNVGRWRRQWADAGVSVTGLDVEVDPFEAEKARRFNEQLTAGRLASLKFEDEDLGEVILRDIQTGIATRYPDHVEVEGGSDLQKEIDQHEEFLFTNSEGFIGRADKLQELDEYVLGDSKQTFVLTAEGGMGKSMLQANWIDRCRRDRSRFGDATFHFRFVGQSDRSTTVPNLLHYFLRELQEVAHKVPDTTTETVKNPDGSESRREVPLAIPQDPAKLYPLWREQLAQLGRRGKTVIVIDALNQLESGLKDLYWLPLAGLPENVKFIVSLKTGEPAADGLLKRLKANLHVRCSEIEPFKNMDDRRELVAAYLSHYLKELDKQHIEKIIELKAAGNPLFLKVVLSELRVFGAFEQLGDKIKRDFGDDPVSAFDAVLYRLGMDPGYCTVKPDEAVPLLFGLLAHARHGLSADELTDLFVTHLGLDKDKKTDRDGAREAVYLFLREVQPFLARREGRYDFFYESFLFAARKRYVADAAPTSPAKRPAAQWHGMLAEYFETRVTGRKQKAADQHAVMEVTFQFMFSSRWSDVVRLYLDYDFLPRVLVIEKWTWLIGDLVETSQLCRTRGNPPHTAVDAILSSLRAISFSFEDEELFFRFVPDAMRNDLLRLMQLGNEPAKSVSGLLDGRLSTRASPNLTSLEVQWITGSGFKSDVGAVRAIAGDPSRAIVVTAGDQLCIWNLGTGRLQQRLPERVDLLALLPGSDLVTVRGNGATLGDGTTVSLWDPESGAKLNSFNSRWAGYTQLAFAENRSHLLLTGLTGYVLHAATAPFQETTQRSGQGVTCPIAAIATNGDVIFVGRGRGVGTLRVVDAAWKDTGIQLPATVTAVALSANGKYLLVGDVSGWIRCYEAEGGLTMLGATQIESSVDPSKLPTEIFWDTKTPPDVIPGLTLDFANPSSPPRRPGLDPRWIRCIVVSPNCKFVAAGCADGGVRIFRVPGLELVDQVHAGCHFVEAVCFLDENRLWVAYRSPPDLFQIRLTDEGKISAQESVASPGRAVARFMGHHGLLRSDAGVTPRVFIPLSKDTLRTSGCALTSSHDQQAYAVLVAPMGQLVARVPKWAASMPKGITIGHGPKCWLPYRIFRSPDWQSLDGIIDLTDIDFLIEDFANPKPSIADFSENSLALSHCYGGKLIFAGARLMVVDVHTGSKKTWPLKRASRPEFLVLRCPEASRAHETPDSAVVETVWHIGILAVSPDGTRAALGWSSGAVDFVEIVHLDAQPPDVEASLQLDNPGSAFAWAPTGNLVVALESGGMVCFDPDSKRSTCVNTLMTNVGGLVFSPKGRWIAAHSADSRRLFVAAGSNLQLLVVEAYPDPIEDMSFSVDESTLFVADKCGNVVAYCLWNDEREAEDLWKKAAAVQAHGQSDEARALLEQAIERYEALRQARPEESRPTLLLASALTQLARACLFSTAMPNGFKHYERALDVLERTSSRDFACMNLRAQLGKALVRAGYQFRGTGAYAQARRCFELSAEALGPVRGSPDLKPDSVIDLCHTHLQLGRIAESRELVNGVLRTSPAVERAQELKRALSRFESLTPSVVVRNELAFGALAALSVTGLAVSYWLWPIALPALVVASFNMLLPLLGTVGLLRICNCPLCGSKCVLWKMRAIFCRKCKTIAAVPRARVESP